ncbi:MAG TPA: glutamate--tRNA ligase [Chroococcales cyanobacterium]
MTSPPRVRIAPSPTGTLHLGTARTALYNYLYARRHNGTFVLRLEDTDEERSREEYTQDILHGLHWLGITWTEGPDVGGPFPPYKQTQKIDHYNNIANQLISKGLAYFAYDTPEELQKLKEQQDEAGQPIRYDNRHRKISEEDLKRFEAEGRVPTVRFRVEEPRVVSWHDAIKGEISVNTSDLGGDMVIVKSNGVAIYNFAVVVDDIDMKMTHVIRGEDHIHNTAKQILIYEALGHDIPVFGHVPLMQDTERHKLSKRRHGEAVHVDQYRKDGYMPEAMVNYLAQMSWSPGGDDASEFFTLEEAGKLFELDRISKSAAVFDVQKLNWFNKHYIMSLPLKEVTQRALPYMQSLGIDEYAPEDLERLIGSVRNGLSRLCEITDAARFYFGKHTHITEELRERTLSTEKARQVLERTLAEVPKLPWADAPGCKAAIDAIGKELGIKGKELYWPVRAALSGKTEGPDLGVMISVLGEERVKARLESCLFLTKTA